MSEITLSGIKGLTTDQYDKCREAALRRVQARIGDRPQRTRFERELGSVWTILDVLALIVFAAALWVSSVHIITHTGMAAQTSFTTLTQATAGISVGSDFYAVTHQLAFIMLAEASMLLFLVLFGMTKSTWRRVVFIALALTAMTFVIVANVSSGIGILESLMAPIFTIGIGLHVERLVIASLKRRQDVTTRYLEALATWETASVDATRHPDYLPMLRQELWQKLMSLKANQVYVDIPAPLKIEAVNKELARELWAYGGDTVALPAAIYNLSPQGVETREVAANDNPLEMETMEAPAIVTNGNGKAH